MKNSAHLDAKIANNQKITVLPVLMIWIGYKMMDLVNVELGIMITMVILLNVLNVLKSVLIGNLY